jgi:hypothetical protein
MVWVSHDFVDKVWDFESLTREERLLTRVWWFGFHVWLLFRPDLLRGWAGVDVLTGKIHRVIDGTEVWEDTPEVIPEYWRLYWRACFLLRCDMTLPALIEENGGVDCPQYAGSNTALEWAGIASR